MIHIVYYLQTHIKLKSKAMILSISRTIHAELNYTEFIHFHAEMDTRESLKFYRVLDVWWVWLIYPGDL